MENLKWIKQTIDAHCDYHPLVELRGFLSCGEELLPKILNPFSPSARPYWRYGSPSFRATVPGYIKESQVIGLDKKKKKKRGLWDGKPDCFSMLPFLITGMMLFGGGGQGPGGHETTPPPYRPPGLPEPYDCSAVEDHTIDEVSQDSSIT